MKISLAISHTPWVPARVESLRRLEELLVPLDAFAARATFDERDPNDRWSEKQWWWAACQDVEWCLFLQDDTVVGPAFHDHLRDAVRTAEAGGFDVVGLHVAHPTARQLFDLGYLGFTTSDALVGVGYLVRRPALQEFLAWRCMRLVEGWRGPNKRGLPHLTEDTMIGVWCLSTGRRIYHPLPAIVDHDVALPSTYGNDGHLGRTGAPRWDTPWTSSGPRPSRLPHVGRYYASTPDLLASLVTGVTPQNVARARGDDGRGELRHLRYQRMAIATTRPATRVFVATPTRGELTEGYASTIWQILLDETVDASCSVEVSDVQLWNYDLTRIRSRFVRHFLEDTDATHLLFVDADVMAMPKVLRGMIAANKGLVAAPYPRRDSLDWARVRARPDVPPEAAAYRYSLRVLDLANGSLDLDESGCAPVASVALGFALIRRAELQALYDAHRSDLTFEDEGRDTVALFHLLLEGGHLFGEDYSFCERWRRAGNEVFAYFGAGSPVDHVGPMIFKGALEAFGMRRGRRPLPK